MKYYAVLKYEPQYQKNSLNYHIKLKILTFVLKKKNFSLSRIVNNSLLLILKTSNLLSKNYLLLK